MHEKFNDILSVIVAVLGLYLIVTPFLPEILFYGKEIIATQDGSATDIGAYIYSETADVQSSVKRLIIPSIHVDGTVYEGESAEVLNEGVWHRPGTSTPDQGGNSVFVAHRFQYTFGPNTFYHLDKVQVGEIVTVIWNGSPYQYEVKEMFEVAPDQVDIEAPSDDSIITLYTCSPLWTAERRLVVRGEIISL